MKTLLITSVAILSCWCCMSQVNYGTPTETEIPAKLKDLKKAIVVQHFPKINNPIKKDNTYYWMHTTSILSTSSDITITEYGAYLYYNDTWNLRKSYPIKELKSTFGIKNGKLKQAQPYVWADNYRTGNQLFGGWALWYFIGTTSNGEIVCGYETIHTTDQLINK